jgi:hypothetical protein
VCGQIPAKSDVVGWTWSRQRIHDACMPAWVLANRGRRPLGPWVAPVIGPLLQRHGGRLCDACLALALSVSLNEAKQVVAVTAPVPGFRILPVQCHSCGRPSEALCVMSSASGGEVLEPKCARCSRRLSGPDIVAEGDNQFHRACWQIISADERIRASRARTRTSRKLIAESQEALFRRSPPA